MSAAASGRGRFAAALLLAAAAVFPAAARAQKQDQRRSPVGMRARVEQVVLPGGRLEVKPADRDDDVLLRIVGTWPHGEMFRYDLEWVGFAAGTYDLADHLWRADADSRGGADDPALPAIEVEVSSQLPSGHVEPEPLESRAPRPLGGYGTLLIVGGVLWGVGLLLILFVGRRKRVEAVAAERRGPTLADRLRPIVAAAASGELDAHGKAELERLLLAWWRERAGLQDSKAGAAVIALRAHPEAGALLRQLEAWLHMPAPPQDVDVEALLAPYRDVGADAVDDAVTAVGARSREASA